MIPDNLIFFFAAVFPNRVKSISFIKTTNKI